MMDNTAKKIEAGGDDKADFQDSAIEYIAEGDLCPNCGFARLKKEPGNIIRCPICGYGNGAGCT